MPDTERIVINTGPLLALIAALGDYGLSLTGSVGILLRAHREGYSFSMQNAIQRMTDKGIWLSERVVTFALNQAGEGNK